MYFKKVKLTKYSENAKKILVRILTCKKYVCLKVRQFLEMSDAFLIANS